MRSVSLFLPAGLRNSGASSQGSVAPDARPRPESGIGIVLDQTADGRLVVEHVWPGSPAASAGICIGDVLLLIDGMQGSVSSVDVAKDLIRGTEGTMVTLQVLRGITQLEFGPIPRMDWLTMQQVFVWIQLVVEVVLPYLCIAGDFAILILRVARWMHTCRNCGRWGRTAGMQGACRCTII